MGLSGYRIRAWARQDSNLQSLAYQTSAMAITLRAHYARTRIRTWIEPLEAVHFFRLNYTGMDRPGGIRTPIIGLGDRLLVRLATGLLAPSAGFEPTSRPRQDQMMDHYTTRAFRDGRSVSRTHVSGFGDQLPTVGDAALMTETGLAPVWAPFAGERISPLPLRQGGRRGSNPSLQVHSLPCSLYTTFPILKVPVGLAPTCFALPRRRLAP